MNFQISRHIEVQEDLQQSQKILMQNLMTHRRLLIGNEIWPILEKFRQPNSLQGDKLEERALNASILEPTGQHDAPTELTKSFERISFEYLESIQVEPSQDLLARLEQLDHHVHPTQDGRKPSAFIWNDPKLVFKVLLDHFGTYLTTDSESSRTDEIDPEFLKMSLGRPPQLDELEQQCTTLHTSWTRAKKIVNTASPNSKILVVGDDDLVSLALSCFPIETIDVLEIESRLVRFLRKKGKDRLRVFRRDLSHGLPEKFKEQYDIVVSDPMYSDQGMTMFLKSCLQALKPTPHSRFFLSTYPPLLENSADFFSTLSTTGFEIRETHTNFNRYPFPKHMRTSALVNLLELGYPPKLTRTLLGVPYLYSHLYECGLKAA